MAFLLFAGFVVCVYVCVCVCAGVCVCVCVCVGGGGGGFLVVCWICLCVWGGGGWGAAFLCVWVGGGVCGCVIYLFNFNLHFCINFQRSAATYLGEV